MSSQKTIQFIRDTIFFITCAKTQRTFDKKEHFTFVDAVDVVDDDYFAVE